MLLAYVLLPSTCPHFVIVALAKSVKILLTIRSATDDGRETFFISFFFLLKHIHIHTRYCCRDKRPLSGGEDIKYKRYLSARGGAASQPFRSRPMHLRNIARVLVLHIIHTLVCDAPYTVFGWRGRKTKKFGQ